MITRLKLPLYYCYCILFQISSVQKAGLNVKTIFNVLDPMTYVILMTIVTISLTRMKISVKVKLYNKTYISNSERITRFWYNLHENVKKTDFIICLLTYFK